MNSASLSTIISQIFFIRVLSIHSQSFNIHPVFSLSHYLRTIWPRRNVESLAWKAPEFSSFPLHGHVRRKNRIKNPSPSSMLEFGYGMEIRRKGIRVALSVMIPTISLEVRVPSPFSKDCEVMFLFRSCGSAYVDSAANSFLHLQRCRSSSKAQLALATNRSICFAFDSSPKAFYTEGTPWWCLKRSTGLLFGVSGCTLHITVAL